MKRWAMVVALLLWLPAGAVRAESGPPETLARALAQGGGPAFWKGFFGTPEKVLEVYDRELLEEVKAGRTSLVDRFLEGVEALDDPSFFTVTVRRLRETIQWQVLHAEDPGHLSSRLPRLGAVLEKTSKSQDPRPIVLPRDGGRHLNKLVEWWYWNGHLFDEARHEYGFELCFFRFGPIIHFAHFAITDVTGGRFLYERTVFSPFSCDLSDQELSLRFGDWEISSVGQEYVSLKAQTRDFAVQLLAKPLKPPLLVNQTGYLQMSSEGHSYYYSQPRWQTTGALRFRNQSAKVTGESWFDHQWGNFLLSTIWGWDWFCFKLTDDTHYNVFCFHSPSGTIVNPLATIQYADGTQVTTRQVGFEPSGWWVSPHTGRRYPAGYVVHLPERQAMFTVTPKVVDQELPADPYSPDFIDYWEGSCSVRGTVGGKPAQGQCYNEICGYPKVAPARPSEERSAVESAPGR